MNGSGFSEFKIDVLPTGQAAITVNGTDISDVVDGFTIQSRLGQPPIVTLFERGGKTVADGMGIVRVSDDTFQAKNAIIQFLRGVNPRNLEREVLDRDGMGTSPMELAVEILREWADGL